MHFGFHVPTKLLFGAGTFQRAGEITASLGKRVFVVTGRAAMDRLGPSERLLNDLNQHSLSVRRFGGLESSPTTTDIDMGAAEAREYRADVVVALGGGSVLDCAKAIAGVAASGRPSTDFLYQRAEVDSKALPLVCIPTTAGTGSELNRSAIVRDSETCFKDGIRSNYLFPRFALVDPELTWTIPKLVTAQTGFDTLAHAIESYVSPKRTPLHDQLALRAMRIVSTYLPIALGNPEHRRAREQLAYASTTMGMNLACVGTCFPHRVDKSLCGLRPDIAHGQSVALFYPHWIDSCFRSETKRFARIASILRPDVSDLPSEEAAGMCSRIVTDWILSIGLQLGLKRFLTNDDLPKLVAGVAGDLSVNPVAIRRADLYQTLQEIFLQDYS